MKCLIVDDILVNIVLAEKMLTSLNFQFQRAGNGQIACDILKQGYEPDLIILDLMMPVMDGFAVLEEIRSGRCGRKDVPIVVLSALNREEDISRAYDLGANAYVTKPIKMINLINTTKKVLEGQNVTTQV